ncbi:hypothetical protein R6Q59_009933 [Mikania micrantha]
MDVATLVKNITSAFDDASALVKRIQEQKEKEKDENAPSEPIDDLLDSVSLGPKVVRGYYEHDAKRFGSAYTAGDAIARGQLKDALINLQMTVLSGLQSVILNGKAIEYDAIQAASDDCRINVGVCLGQLSQRISQAAKGLNGPGRLHTYDNLPMRSNTGSTQSSGHTKFTPMTPPESDTEFLSDRGTSMSEPSKYTARAPDLDVMDGMHRTSYSGLYTSSMATSFRQHNSSSGTLPKFVESPHSPRFRDSSLSTASGGSYPIAFHAPPYHDGAGQNVTPGDNASWGYFRNPSPRSQQSDPSRSSPHNTVNISPQQRPLQPEPVRPTRDYEYDISATLGKRETSNLVPIARKPIASPTSPAFPNATSIHQLSIPEEEEKIFYHPPPGSPYSQSRPSSSPVSQGPSSYSNLPRYQSVTTAVPTRRDTTSSSSSGPATLPTDKNLLGFCKGAFRLQAGMEKKAFVVANRPLGYSSMVQYWKCDKCYFEGPCTTLIRPGSKKPEKIFDPVIRSYGGIRYRWAFLAKSHVPLKSVADGKTDGTYGGFCCVFCTAEGTQRKWNLLPATFSADKSSIRSSSSGASSSAGTAVFGNIHGFMDHLEIHRQPEYAPGQEMQGRMKVIMGRAATRGEEFDINFLPLDE